MDLYREELIEHYKNPLNWGKLENKTSTTHEANPLCGDELDVDIVIESGVLKDLAFKGQGCAISIAAASIFFDEVKGKSVEEIKGITKESLLAKINPNLTISRIKCATLGFNALMKMLQDK